MKAKKTAAGSKKKAAPVKKRTAARRAAVPAEKAAADKAKADQAKAAEKPGARQKEPARRRLTDAQEAFVLNIIDGMPQSEAYRKAYPNDRSSDAVVAKNASATLAKPHVRARYEFLLEQIRKERARRSVMSAADVLEELTTIAASDIGNGDIKTSDKLKALELLGKHLALFTDRHEVEGGGLCIRLEGYDGPDG